MTRLIFTVLAAALSCSVIQASPITYTLSTTASGTFAGSVFTNALVTVTLMGDTSNVVAGPGPFINTVLNPVTAVLSVFGVGTGTFTDPITLISTLNAVTLLGAPAVLIVDGPLTTGTGLLLQTGSIFQTYDLRTALGPITGPGGVASGSQMATNFPTTGGNLSWAIGQSMGTSTFTAVIAPTNTPEPGTWILLGSGLAAAFARRRFKSPR